MYVLSVAPPAKRWTLYNTTRRDAAPGFFSIATLLILFSFPLSPSSFPPPLPFSSP